MAPPTLPRQRGRETRVIATEEEVMALTVAPAEITTTGPDSAAAGATGSTVARSTSRTWFADFRGSRRFSTG